jgi:hypothetical protein
MTAVPNTPGSFSGDPTGAAAIFTGEALGTVPAPMADPSGVVARLNSLLRGEISAAETYRDVLEKLAVGAHTNHVEPLTAIQAEHGRSCRLLRERITDLGGQPADSSGVWGIWAQAVQSALSLFAGDVGSFRALREGEEHGQRDYETALNEVDAITAQLIQDRLLPAQQQHLALLDDILRHPQAGV